MLRFLVFLICFSAVASAQSRIETGEINGAPFRIDIPEHWNGTLLVYCHGYSTAPVVYDKQPAKLFLKAMLDTDAAVAQSGYSAVGWAIQQATVDTESLRRYFVQKYGQPKQTFITGHSMGGFLTMMLMETQPTTYNGGLSFCGPLVPAGKLVTGAFNARVVFDYFFPEALPDPSHVPPGFKPSKERAAKLEQLLTSKPDAADAMRRYMTIKNNKDLAAGMDFVTYVLKDIQQRSGGNPFDNRGTIYTITGNDNDLNEHVKRYAADPGAFEYLRTYYTPTGRLVHPLLQVHTTYDPLVSPAAPNSYRETASEAGSQKFYAQQFVEHDGHCNISPEETGKAIRELQDWVEQQKVPESGLLKVQ